MKTDTVYKRTFNQMLDLVSAGEPGARIPSETQLSSTLGVSRTTIRKVLGQLCSRRILRFDDRARFIRTTQCSEAYFPLLETVSTSDQVEKQFMEWMLRGDTKPGTLINELEMARQFAVGTTGIREFLNRFSRFGLIEKRPNSGWLFKGFTESFASELFEIREMFELRSALAFSRLPKDNCVWKQLKLIEQEHHALLAHIDTRFHDFSDLDNRFHRLVNCGAPNRFVDDFHEIISFVFHYHYQWNKADEKERNEVAIAEHLAYINALSSGDAQHVERACRDHLLSARTTLIKSITN
ncbi:MAG: GntR family transcriptional regulator [Rhizobiaceae bacterium]|nr:GntR family transcriptional regulator [Rhizobiaceae bacterium]